MIIYEHILTFYAMIIYKRMITSLPIITSLLVITREKEKMSVYFNRECRRETSFDWIIV